MATQANPSAGFPPDVLVALDRSAGRGLRSQLEAELRRAVQDGRLTAGARLPPSRVLARDLGVARSVVVDAYGQLVADGYLHARQGSATRVRAIDAHAPSRIARAERPATAQFIGGLPDPACFPRRDWLRHYRAALASVPDAALNYPGPHGAAQLHAALANYLGRVRGVTTSPERMLIATGFTQALVLVCRVLRARGVERVAVEDPCFGLHRQAIAATGLQPVPVGVDEDGIDVAALARSDPGAVLVAPAHSYPTGAVLSPTRRGQLVAWARRHDALVIEDDYDAEFRYDRAPVGALQGLAPEYVIYAGCASKTLSPALRLGWLAAPTTLIDELAREKAFDDLGSALLEQLALARLIDSGDFTRHLRRVRPRYRARRDAALRAVAEHLPHATPIGIHAGLHLYLKLPGHCHEPTLIDAARHHGVHVEGAAWHYEDPDTAPPALVLGYGSQTEPAIRRGVATLGAVYRDLARSASA